MRSAATRTDAFAMTTKTVVRMKERVAEERVGLMRTDGAANETGVQQVFPIHWILRFRSQLPGRSHRRWKFMWHSANKYYNADNNFMRRKEFP